MAETALKRLDLDWIWWIVARGNPLKESHGAYDARLASARRLARHPRMRVTDIEAQLGVNYTADLIDEIHRRRPEAHFVWIMGGDNLAGFHRWGRWREIAETLPIAVVARPNAGARERNAKAFQVLAQFRKTQGLARALPTATPPAWVYLQAPWNPASSTALRGRARRRNPFRRGDDGGRRRPA